jgi:RNA polymerase sigma factor (sigma-70 family)
VLGTGSLVSTAASRTRLRLASDERLVAWIRRGDAGAFTRAYERHSPGLLSFCTYLLGSRQDAEDAVQATYSSAYRALLSDRRPITLRPWLFAIARNESLDILRGRQTTVELNGEAALTGDPVRHLEVREELRHLTEDVRRLPERQRSALVLAELEGLSQAEIGVVLGVRAQQVKAFIYQGRSSLLSERDAREADCEDVREELATARGAALRRRHLRRHLRSCSACHDYAAAVSRQQRQLRALAPITPALALKYRVLEQVLGIGGADPANYVGGTAGTAFVAELAGGGIKALAIKLAAGVVALGAGADVGVSVLHAPASSHGPRAAATGGRSSAMVANASSRTSSGTQVSLRDATNPSRLRRGVAGAGERALSQTTAGPAPSATDPAGAPETQVDPPPPATHSPRPSKREDRTTTSPPPSDATSERQRERTALEATRQAHQALREEHQKLREERRKQHEEHPGKEPAPGEHAPEGTEEPPPVGHSRSPKKSKEEREQAREEHLRKKEEREKLKEAPN